MLESLTIQNLGCFDNDPYTINFKTLNLITGPNNSGKSTFFKGLNFLKHFSQTGDIAWSSPFFHLAGFSDSVYSHDTSLKISIIAKYSENKNAYEAKFVINNKGVVTNDFLQNNVVIDNLQSGKHNSLVNLIWYISPTRASIPYQSSIVGISGPQPLSPNGANLTQFLLEKWSQEDPKWKLMLYWLNKIDPRVKSLKTPIHTSSSTVQVTTTRDDDKKSAEINVSLQGSGIQNIATIIAAVIFSPPNSTIIIEEPENFLHSNGIEILIDLFNTVIKDESKQIILTTHSWELLTSYAQEVSDSIPPRKYPHTPTIKEGFKLIGISSQLKSNKVQEFDITGKTLAEIWNFCTATLYD